MAGQRRTRAEKEQAQKHRVAQLSYSYSAPSSIANRVQSGTKRAVVTAARASIAQLFDYDVNLIYGDLRKTLLITAGILVILAGVVFGYLSAGVGR